MAAASAVIASSDSRASRVARQRQERSILRTAQLPLDEAGTSASTSSRGMPDANSELQILRAEVANSGATISKLQSQLRQSDAEMEALGSQTARMAEELRKMQEIAAALGASKNTVPSAADASTSAEPMAVSIALPEDGSLDVSVRICISSRQETMAAP